MELKDKIVQAALDIFSEYGYEKATIAQIVEKAESSKGGFYHHFASKKEVLDEITNRYLMDVMDAYNQMLENSQDDIITQLNNVFFTINTIKKQRLEHWEQMGKLYAHEGSDAILHKTMYQFIELTAGIYEGLIKKGIEQKIFDVKYPKALAGMWSNEITKLYAKVTEIVVGLSEENGYEEFLEQAQFVEENINHNLGAGAGVISIKKPAVEYLDMAIAVAEAAKKK